MEEPASASSAIEALTIQLTRMETRVDLKLDQLLARDDDHEKRLRRLESRSDPAIKISDHETRLRSLEAWRWKLTGAVLVAGALGGGTGAAIAPLFGG